MKRNGPKVCARCYSPLWNVPRRNDYTKYYKNVLNDSPLCKVLPRTKEIAKDKLVSAKIALQWIEENRKQKIENDKELGRQLLYSGLEVQ